MTTSLSLKISTDEIDTNAEELRRITSQVEELGQQDSWPPELVYLVNLTLEELGLNALTHGRDLGLNELEITIKSEMDKLVIEISDNGAPFDPLKDAPIPDPKAPLETRPIGGLGIYLVRQVVDDIQYRRGRGRNHLTLITRRSQ